MELKELETKSKKILANFVNAIGLDGEFYISTCNCPMIWGTPKFNACGEFIEPGSTLFKDVLYDSNLDKGTQKKLIRRGIIVINKIYKQKDVDHDLLITVIHEMLHSNRNLLLFDTTRNKLNENSYSFNNGKFECNTSEYAFSYHDASQEILKGNIDTSKNTTDTYKDLTIDEIEDIDFFEGKRDFQMKKQLIVDESLVELMATTAYKLYRNIEKGKTSDIWDILEQIKNVYESKNADIGAICNIILRHKDFDLFNWMLDPISYSQGNMHYDFFNDYTKNDQDLLEELYDSDELDIDSLLEDNDIDVSGIGEL